MPYVRNIGPSVSVSPNASISPVPPNSPVPVPSVPRPRTVTVPVPSVPRPRTATVPVQSLGIREQNGKFVMKGKTGRMIKVGLKVSELKNYAARKGINLAGAKLKKDILKRIANKKSNVKVSTGGRVYLPGKKIRPIRANRMKVAELKEYAARKGINLAGAKLKKDIIARIKA